MKREKILRDMYIKFVQLNAKTKDIFQETLTYISFCIQILVNRKCSSFVNSFFLGSGVGGGVVGVNCNEVYLLYMEM